METLGLVQMLLGFFFFFFFFFFGGGLYIEGYRGRVVRAILL